MRYYIGPEGPRDAEWAIVAEKPGYDELQLLTQTGAGRPLIGASGKMVDAHLIRVGTHRSRVWLTNAVQNFDTLGNPTDQDIQREQVRLGRELMALPRLKCVVAMGASALASLSNFHMVDIANRRGSILETWWGLKMVPTYHPSFYMHGEWRFKPVVEFDLKRAYEQSRFPDIRRPERTYYVEPTFREAVDLLQGLRGAAQISFDIETFRGHIKGESHISCIAFSTSPETAFCIPFMRGSRASYWEDPATEAYIWTLIQAALDQPRTSYITQNGLFDTWHLWRHGIVSPHMGRGFDTMYSHRYIAPGMPHDLAFLVSIYTEEPYYKDESGNWASDVRVPDHQFWLYNCKDAACTMEVAIAETQDMAELEMLDYYQTWVQTQWPALARMRQQGIRVDPVELIAARQKLARDRDSLEATIKGELGWIPNTKSYINMKKALDLLRVPYQLTKTGKPKTDKESMYTYAARFPHARETLMNCLSITKVRTTVSNFMTIALDGANRYHASIDLEKDVTGRNASEGDEHGGPQIHNIPKPVRKLFLPDDDESELTQADMKQAEAMVVAWDARDPLLMATFKAGKDIHRVRACLIYRDWVSQTLPPDDLLASIQVACPACLTKGETECNHSERYMGKQSGHALVYRMGPRRFCTEQAKNNVFITEHTAKVVRKMVVSQYIQDWWTRTEVELLRTGWLRNHLGRKREFYGTFDDKMLNQALSWIAQSTVNSVKERAILYLEDRLPEGSRIVTETHDSVLISGKVWQRAEIVRLTKEAFDVQLDIHGDTLTIPIDVTHGPSWGEQRKVA